MVDIKSLDLNEITDLLTSNAFEKYRAKQVLLWLKSGVTSFDDMKNIPKSIKEFLKRNTYLACAEVERKLVSKLDATVKYLFKMYDGEYVESVVMEYHHGSTICISTQVGCKMGCDFCATGKSGFSRNLTASEMIAQIQSAQIDLNKRISNVVLMGMGEPFDNYENLIKFLQLVSSEDSLNIGMRHITVSTCGIVPKIYEFADLKTQCNLSISLHAVNDKKRSEIMPINRKYNLDELIKACKYYTQKTNRRITFEYAMIHGVNDTEADGENLAKLINGILCHVNLIPVNIVSGSSYKKSKNKSLDDFSNILSKYKVNSTIRRTLGSDINASCGQLKRNMNL